MRTGAMRIEAKTGGVVGRNPYIVHSRDKVAVGWLL
jgi:hypothetical protein